MSVTVFVIAHQRRRLAVNAVASIKEKISLVPRVNALFVSTSNGKAATSFPNRGDCRPKARTILFTDFQCSTAHLEGLLLAAQRVVGLNLLWRTLYISYLGASRFPNCWKLRPLMAVCGVSHLYGCRNVGQNVAASRFGAWEHDCVATVSGYAHQSRERRSGKVRAPESWISQTGGKLEVVGQWNCGDSSGFVEARIGAQRLFKTGLTAGDDSPKLRGGFSFLRQKALAGAAALVGVSLALCSSALAETLVLVDAPRLEDVLALEARLEEQVRLDIEGAIRGQDVDCRVGAESADADGHEKPGLATLPVNMSASLLAPELAFDSVSSAPAIGMCVSAVATPAVATLAAARPAVSGAAQVLARAAQHFSGGGIAGAVGAALVYPLDTIKTRMQAQKTEEGEAPQYKNEVDCFRQLVANEGPASLYDGLLPQLVGIAPEKAMKLTVNELLLEMLESTMPGARIWALEFIAGGGGGFSQVVFTNPMEMIKVRLQTQSKDGAPQNAWEVAKDLGVQGLYTGASITIARDVPSSAIFFSCYTLLRQLYPEHSLAAGCLAAIPATVLVTPFDIVKTRLQKAPVPGEEPVGNAWEYLQQLWLKEPTALFKGALVRVLRTSPQFGVTLLIYETLCK